MNIRQMENSDGTQKGETTISITFTDRELAILLIKSTLKLESIKNKELLKPHIMRDIPYSEESDLFNKLLKAAKQSNAKNYKELILGKYYGI